MFAHEWVSVGEQGTPQQVQDVAQHDVVREDGRFGWFVDPEGNKIELWEPAG